VKLTGVDLLQLLQKADETEPRLMDYASNEIFKRVILTNISTAGMAFRPDMLALGARLGRKDNDRELRAELARLDRDGFADDLLEHIRKHGPADKVRRLNEFLSYREAAE
jgi:hypothetical protein